MYVTVQCFAALNGVLCMTPYETGLPAKQMNNVRDVMKNQLLGMLGESECARLLPWMDEVEIAQDDVLYESGRQMHYVYFPVNVLIAMMYVTESGASSEIAIIGNDGMVGIALFMGGDTTPGRAVAQSDGVALRLPGRKLKDEFHRNGRMHDVLLRYTQGLLTQMAQTAVCTRHHHIDQQLSRLLLLALDRLPLNRIEMTHERLANMLGVRREGVTEAAGKLQKSGAISYSRGHIEVLDRNALEWSSCECWSVVKQETNRLKAIL